MEREFLLKDIVVEQLRLKRQTGSLGKKQKLNQWFGKLKMIFSQQPAI